MKKEHRGFEAEMLDVLHTMSESGCLWGVKAEFEAEGTRFLELVELVRISRMAGIKLAVKIGGCEAIRDLDELKKLGVDAIVAPMVESGYAVRKFDEALVRVFGSGSVGTQFLVNFETAVAWQNKADIFGAIERAKKIDGIVFGRVDFSLSSGFSRDDINSEPVKDVALHLSSRTKDIDGGVFVVGGGVSALSFPLLEEVNKVKLDRFETRKIVFDAPSMLPRGNREDLLKLAMRFEIAWLNYKREQASLVSIEDDARITMLEDRWLN